LPKNLKLKINRLIMRWDLDSLLLLFMELFINVRKESNLTLLNVPQLKKYRYDLAQLWEIFYLLNR